MVVSNEDGMGEEVGREAELASRKGEREEDKERRGSETGKTREKRSQEAGEEKQHGILG